MSPLTFTRRVRRTLLLFTLTTATDTNAIVTNEFLYPIPVHFIHKRLGVVSEIPNALYFDRA